MGKIRVKTLGGELEKEQKKEIKVKKEQKEARKMAKGAHGGERVVAVGPSEAELAQLDEQESQKKVLEEKPGEVTEGKESGKKKIEKKTGKPRERSTRYKQAISDVDRNRTYPLPDALELLKKVSLTKFDGTVELHINTIEKGVHGQITLPHGTGKTVRVAIADDAVIAEIEKGKIEFDILLAHPSMMPKLAKVARVLGPRGLMPNPKAGTISENPEKIAEKFKAGQIQFKTEAEAPIIHLVVGKISMEDKNLSENIKTVVTAIGVEKIRDVTLKSTMSPGIKVSVS